MNAVGYIRVSTEKQEDNGISLPAQRAKYLAWLKLNDAKNLGIFEEARSGKTIDKRPEFQKTLELVCSEKATLVVYSIFRLSRTVKDAIEIIERIGKAGGNVVFLRENIDTTTPMGEAIFTMIASLGQLQRRMIAESTKNALHHKRDVEGKVLGSLPFGFKRRDDAVVKDGAKFDVVERILALREDGVSFQAIAKKLNEDGIPTKREGSRWYASTVRGIARNPLYKIVLGRLREVLGAEEECQDWSSIILAGSSTP